MQRERRSPAASARPPAITGRRGVREDGGSASAPTARQSGLPGIRPRPASAPGSAACATLPCCRARRRTGSPRRGRRRRAGGSQRRRVRARSARALGLEARSPERRGRERRRVSTIARRSSNVSVEFPTASQSARERPGGVRGARPTRASRRRRSRSAAGSAASAAKPARSRRDEVVRSGEPGPGQASSRGGRSSARASSRSTTLPS
jgi:hypothetical protein